VDLVILTHIHDDHNGWNLAVDGDEPATFPHTPFAEI
jgi:glyoxylase-like metal-dependent hydrolase (beta-lactamase superfamily II)